MTDASFSRYQIPRMKDVPEIEVELINRPDLPSVGAGETRIIATATAVANPVADATRQRESGTNRCGFG